MEFGCALSCLIENQTEFPWTTGLRAFQSEFTPLFWSEDTVGHFFFFFLIRETTDGLFRLQMSCESIVLM